LTAFAGKKAPCSTTFVVYFLLDIGALNAMLAFRLNDVGYGGDQLLSIAVAAIGHLVAFVEKDGNYLSLIQGHR
jgi:hypothetical protein